MAESKSNVIEYSFEGNTLDLQQAVKRVSKLLSSTVKELKTLQGGKLTKEQAARVKNVRALVRQMKAAVEVESSLDTESKKKLKRAGTFALNEAKRLASETKKVREELAKKEEKIAAKRAARQKQIEESVSIAGQESAKQHATYLEEYADKFKQVLSPAAYDEIKQSVAEYRTAVEDTSLTEEELAEITERLQTVYKNYAQILQAINRSQQQASKGILNVSDFFVEARRQALVAVKTFSFWLQVLRAITKYTQEYLGLLESLRRNGQLNNPKLKGLKETADSWRTLSRQVSIFLTNIGALTSKLLAPAAKMLSRFLMLINAILSAFSDVSDLAEEAYSGAGLTGLDEINSQQENEEDNLKKLTRGWAEMSEEISGVINLMKLLGEIAAPVWKGFIAGFGLVTETLTATINAIGMLANWFLNLIGVEKAVTEEGSVLGFIFQAIGSAAGVLVAIALAKWLTVAAAGFAKLAAKIVFATAKLVIYIAKTIASTVATWWENASLIAKVGLLTLGAGLVLAPVILAASGAFSSKASEVPAMATGGVVDAPTLAMIGEGKYSEAVIPLGNSPQFTSMKEGIAESVANRVSGARSQSSTGRPIILQLNGKELARALMPELGNTQMQTGVRLK